MKTTDERLADLEALANELIAESVVVELWMKSLMALYPDHAKLKAVFQTLLESQKHGQTEGFFAKNWPPEIAQQWQQRLAHRVEVWNRFLA